MKLAKKLHKVIDIDTDLSNCQQWNWLKHLTALYKRKHRPITLLAMKLAKTCNKIIQTQTKTFYIANNETYTLTFRIASNKTGWNTLKRLYIRKTQTFTLPAMKLAKTQQVYTYANTDLLHCQQWNWLKWLSRLNIRIHWPFTLPAMKLAITLKRLYIHKHTFIILPAMKLVKKTSKNA